MTDIEQRPYAGLNVLDLSQGIAGPYCAALLAQQGAGHRNRDVCGPVHRRRAWASIPRKYWANSDTATQ